jgi:hypothetical protein
VLRAAFLGVISTLTPDIVPRNRVKLRRHLIAVRIFTYYYYLGAVSTARSRRHWEEESYAALKWVAARMWDLYAPDEKTRNISFATSFVPWRPM